MDDLKVGFTARLSWYHPDPRVETWMLSIQGLDARVSAWAIGEMDSRVVHRMDGFIRDMRQLRNRGISKLINVLSKPCAEL